jgi:hypothetical protein
VGVKKVGWIRWRGRKEEGTIKSRDVSRKKKVKREEH